MQTLLKDRLLIRIHKVLITQATCLKRYRSKKANQQYSLLGAARRFIDSQSAARHSPPSIDFCNLHQYATNVFLHSACPNKPAAGPRPATN